MRRPHFMMGRGQEGMDEARLFLWRALKLPRLVSSGSDGRNVLETVSEEMFRMETKNGWHKGVIEQKLRD